MVSILSRFSRDAEGVAAIEFAILAPLFICMMFSMIGWGIYLGVSHSVQQIAADTARVAISGLSEGERESLALNFVSSQQSGDFPPIRKEKLKVQVADSKTIANQFTVMLTYDASDLPVWGLMTFVMPDPLIIKTTTIRIGGL